MRSQLKNFILTAVVVIGLLGLWSCKGGSSTPTPVPPHTPGMINGTLNLHLGGTTPLKCTAPAVTWTASSPAGSTQTKTSPATALTDNVMSKCDTYTFEATTYTSCSCPVSALFTSLAPGTWTVQASGVNCSVKVNPGQTSTATLYTDGRACTTFP